MEDHESWMVLGQKVMNPNVDIERNPISIKI